MKYRIRKTGEIVNVISYSAGTDRNEYDYVSYIDSNGIEHHKVKGLNINWDFEMVPCDYVDSYMKWEYKVVHVPRTINNGDGDLISTLLNNFGDLGWEVVGIIDILTVTYRYLLKRPVLNHNKCNVSTI